MKLHYYIWLLFAHSQVQSMQNQALHPKAVLKETAHRRQRQKAQINLRDFPTLRERAWMGYQVIVEAFCTHCCSKTEQTKPVVNNNQHLQ